LRAEARMIRGCGNEYAINEISLRLIINSGLYEVIFSQK
jgi:hypothetical protein